MTIFDHAITVTNIKHSSLSVCVCVNDLLKKLKKEIRELSQKGATLRYVSYYRTYARVSILFLKELLQMPVASAGGVGELGSALLDE